MPPVVVYVIEGTITLEFDGRQRLKTERVSDAGQEAERAVYVMLLKAPEEGLYRTLESAVRALKAARREADSPSERWLREQLQDFGE